MSSPAPARSGADRNQSAVADLLASGGRLEKEFPNFIARAPQLAMAEAVSDALADGHHLLVEAGTGTGKTFAYLIPALLSGKRVVISTGTRVLQDQVFEKDVAALATILPVAGRVAVLKGRSNYLCIYKYGPFMRAGGRGDQADRAALAEWAGTTETGDLAELKDLSDDAPLRREVSVTAEQCLGGRCPDFESCFITEARRRAMRADVVVVNHHLMFADLGVKSGAFGEVIPRYDAVIFDEAHLVEEVATSFFGVRVSGARLKELCDDAVREGLALSPTSSQRLEVDARRAMERWHPVWAWLAERGPTNGRQPLRKAALGPPFEEAAKALIEGFQLLAVALARHQDHNDELFQLARRAEVIGSELDCVLGTQVPDMVYWYEASRSGVGAVGASPLNVGALLGDHLYARTHSVIYTSATLATGGSLDYLRERLGLREQAKLISNEGAADDLPVYTARDLCVGSPFDYAEQALLYLPGHLPSPKEPSYAEAAANEITHLMQITGGRALLLFTSYRMLEAVYSQCGSLLEGRVMKQGDMPRAELLKAMTIDAPAILFATGSFWQGVDVPGEALSCVVIDRLPFASPDDPVLSARVRALEQAGRNAFMDFQVPMAALTLKQGVGRLIRGVDDRGVVAILDHRIHRTRYGKAFVESLPPMRRTHDRADVAAFFSSQSSDVTS